MAQLTATQIIVLARKKILEVSTAILSDDDLLLYANLAKDDVAKRLLSNDLIKPTTLSFSGGQATKPTDFESHYLSKDSQTPGQGNVFEWVNLEDFRAGKYERMLTLVDGKILVFPTNTSLLYTDYYKKLDDMTSGGACPLDSALHLAIVYKTAAHAFQDLQDFELSEHFEKKYEIEFGVKGQAISYSEESSQQSNELFNPIQII